MSFIPAELIKKKKLGGEHSPEEIRWIVHSFTEGQLPDYQMSAWAMAVCFKGMTDNEIAALTEAMRDSGKKFNFKSLNGPRIDKHSTGGIGDKTTLIVGPVLAAAGVYVPMIAGRGLGHTGGTLDKLESVPGFRVRLTREEFEAFVATKFFALMGQTEDICPADRKLYALRDVTATVDSLPLICGSIMSKKLAEDLTGLVLDVKFGSGAFMKTVPEAIQLAKLLKATGEKNGLRVTALITNMNEPLGRFVGNSVEVKECVDIMAGRRFIENDIDFYETTRSLSLAISGHMLFLADKVATPEDGFELAQDILTSGRALKAFEDLLLYQGPAKLSELPVAKFSAEIKCSRAGFLYSIDTELVGLAGIELGAGRKTSRDKLDYSAGIEVCARLGQRLNTNQTIFKIFSNSNSNFSEVSGLLESAIRVQDSPPKQLLPLVAKVLT